jgi:CheY-like chemotaxis protein
MPAGGVLTLETGAVHFTAEEISAGRHPEARAGRFACLRVSDTGTGMPPEVLTHLFEPFFTTKEVGKGTGLGLATVHGIVHQHQGWIEVESTLGQGSTFRLYLPISPRDPTASPAVPRVEVAPGRGTILLVEDEPAVRLVTAAMLRRLGYHVLEAGHGPEALGVWQQHGAAVDLLVADMVMPHGMTGLELAETFRRAKPSLGIVIVSGYAEEIVKGEAGLKEGFTFVAKPYEFAVLAGVIQQTLARS